MLSATAADVVVALVDDRLEDVGSDAEEELLDEWFPELTMTGLFPANFRCAWTRVPDPAEAATISAVDPLLVEDIITSLASKKGHYNCW